MSDRDRATVACTIVARNYLPAARVLAASYLAHHPGHRFVIALIDGDGQEATVGGAETLGPGSLGIDSETYLRMATAYTVMELATAIKPFLLRELLVRADLVVYLDPDIEVYASLDDVTGLAAEHGVVLTPHNLEPMPRDGKEPDEAVIMGTGLFNLGFIAVGPGSESFLDFWAERLERDAIVAPERQLFTDQRWVDYVPSLFRHHVSRDRGLNVAYWNAWERPLSREEGGTIRAAGQPLRFVHFSGYQPDKPWLLSSHCARDPRVLLSEHPILRELCDRYAARLRAAGHAPTPGHYHFSVTADGEPLTGWMRRTFRTAWADAQRDATSVPPHAFGPDGGKELLRWLASPAEPRQSVAGVNRLVMQVWERRADLQRAFPDPSGEHAAAFRYWCRNSGLAEGELPAWALPDEVPAPRPPEDRFGVNLMGYLTAELGLGEMGRIVHDALAEARVPTASIVEERSVSNRTGLPGPLSAGDPVFPVTLLCVNADQTRTVLGHHPEIAYNRYVIGLWAWELEDFPGWMHEAFDLVDEVWTISEFCRKAIARHATVRVRTIPVPVRQVGAPPSPRHNDETVCFLFAFDFNSVGERKNPWGLVEAFRRAFPDRDGVRLTIKAINTEWHPHDAERLRIAVAADDRIQLLERYLSPDELDELYADADCYVSLHRSEGFGLTVAEAMARGLPTIATGYSGTTDFTTARTGWSIGYELVPVGSGCFPYHGEAMWAAPDLDEAARAMRAVADDPETARRAGQAAREHVMRTRSMAVASRWFASRIDEAYRHWQARQHTASLPDDTGPLVPLHAAREALRWRADPAGPSRLPLAPALRAAVLRVIDHYDVHQRSVHGAMLDGVEGGLQALVARIENLEEQLRFTRAELGRMIPLLQRLEQVEERLDQVAGARLNAIEARIQDEARRTHGMFMERDHRTDHLETGAGRLERDIAVLVRAAEHSVRDVPVDAVPVLCDAGVLLYPTGDQVVAPWVQHHRSWEEPESELLERLAHERPGTFLDLGSHVGYHTVRLLGRVPLSRAVAIEPQPDLVELLRANVGLAGLDDRVSVLPVAAWDSNGSVGLRQYEPGNSGDVRVCPDGEHRVDAVRLDGVGEVQAHRVTVVKIDLQGRDHRALEGLRETLARDEPDVICEFCPETIEELGDDPHVVIDWYRSLGYQPHDLSGARHSSTHRLVSDARDEPTGFLTLWLRPGTQLS